LQSAGRISVLTDEDNTDENSRRENYDERFYQINNYP